MKNKSNIQRVDFQAAMLVTIFVIISGLLIFYTSYNLSYRQMMDSLADRALAIATYVDKKIPSAIFKEITLPSKIKTYEYMVAHSFLSDIKEISTAKNLHTIIKDSQGVFVYNVDTLAQDNVHFRKPGTPINENLQQKLDATITNNELFSAGMQETQWGDVFVAYYPICGVDSTEVVGLLGIELPTTQEQIALSYICRTAPIVILITCLIAFFVSNFLFRRISNPLFKDLSNTDVLTGLKNRNAYELDLENYMQSKYVTRHAIVLTDLNGLKAINDAFGHKAGDEYIRAYASILKAHANHNYINYRIGGDEFCTFIFNPKEEEILLYIQTIKKELEARTKEDMPLYGVACGYAISDTFTDKTWVITQETADVRLYDDKKDFYAKNRQFNARKNI